MNSPEPFIAVRTCTEIKSGKSDGERMPGSLPLKDFAEAEAYVLLGAPGSGKTSEFKRQAELLEGQFVSVRDFLTFDVDEKPEWHGTTLYIDALDEKRAGLDDGRSTLDAIRSKLQKLNRSRFRLSCREADWFGSNDRNHLEAVATDGKVRVLRLDPLSAANIRTILRNNLGVEDPDTFVEIARQRGVAGLLENPLNLELLAKAVLDNKWPESRTQTFEMACNRLANEFNEEHLCATKLSRADTSELLEAAGKICSIQLLAGAAGIRVRVDGQNDDCIVLNELTGTSRDVLLQSLGTRMFEFPDAEIATPIHRQVAEFLGARYLAQLVANGLPVRRILALMSGYDGMIVAELRGLCAWLATHSLPARSEIIQREPLGAILYGDISGFSAEAKEQILRELKQVAEKNPWFAADIKLDSRLGDLVCTELRDAFLTLLNDPGRDDGRQSLTLFLVETLVHARPLEGVARKLLEIIRDESRWPKIRQCAIKAFLQQQGNEEKALSDLKKLMKEVYDRQVSDPDDELLGELLDITYPRVLPGTEVLDYLRATGINQLLANEVFWIFTLAGKSDCEQKAEILDEFAARYESLDLEARQTKRRSKISTEIPLILLDRYLTDCTSAVVVEPRRLFNWLGVAGRVGDWGYDIGYSHKERDRIRSRLSEHPDLWKTLMELGLQRCIDMSQHPETENFQQLMWMEEDRRLFGSSRPIDFASWFLDQAVISDDPNAAKWLIRRVADAIRDDRISRNSVDHLIKKNDHLKNSLEERLLEHQYYSRREDRLHQKEKREEEKEQKEEGEELSKWQITVQENRDKLIDNHAPAQFLHKLATAYFGGYHGMTGYSPISRLNILLDNDGQLVEIALTGLRGVVNRADLPSESNVVKLGAQGEMQYLWLPFLAGFNELSQSSPDDDSFPNENQKRLAILLYFNINFWPNPWGKGDAELQPSWLNNLLQNQPILVAEAFTQTVAARLLKGLDVSNRLYSLAYSTDHEKVARISTLPLLNTYPVRCKEQQLQGLKFLLIAAHRHCQNDKFIELIKSKLRCRSMNIAQRVFWLTAGFLELPQNFRNCLHDYVAGNSRRVTYLNQYISGRFEYSTKQSEQIEGAALSSFIQLVGAMYPPYSSDSGSGYDAEDDGEAAEERDASFRINNYISQLMSDSSAEASQELLILVEDGSLKAWHTQLNYAANRQKSTRREAEFRHADVPKINAVLCNMEPANPADLAALTMDNLNKIGVKIKDDNTSDWRQYWNVDPYNRPERPKPEDACRDALLSDLQQRLASQKVDAQPEEIYVNDKRADICVTFGDFNIPVEIKKSCSPDLWSAMRNQLIAQYTRDPGADGHGIYLIFWFGNTKHCRPTPAESSAPKSAAELEQRLREGLSDSEQRKISVCVIDVEGV